MAPVYNNAGWSRGYSPQIARQAGQGEDWASGFSAEGKGKGRAQPHQQPEQYQSYAPQMAMGGGGMMGMGMGMGYQPSFQPMYSGYNQQQPAVASQPTAHIQALSEKEHAEMEAAFEKAFEEARAGEPVEAESEQLNKEEQGPPAEEMREAKGEFEKVWESLRPEAERLNKLAEWENEFSQVS